MAYRRFKGPKGWFRRATKRRLRPVKRLARRAFRAAHGRHRRQY